MTNATQRQYDEAVRRLKVAEEALEAALKYQTEPEGGGVSPLVWWSFGGR